MALDELNASSPADPTAGSAHGYRARALLLWPRLDRRRLARTGGDPRRIARLVCRRSSLPVEVIVAMLTESVDPS